MKMFLIAAANIAALATAVCINLPAAERGIGKVALSTGHYELGVQLYTDSLRRELAKCVQA